MTNTEKFSSYSSSFGKSCRNFAANIFDQTKCKNCMQPREEHLGVEDAKARIIARLSLKLETFDKDNIKQSCRAESELQIPYILSFGILNRIRDNPQKGKSSTSSLWVAVDGTARVDANSRQRHGQSTLAKAVLCTV